MSSSTDLSAQLASIRPKLLAFARLQLRDAHWAEDVVQETLMSVLNKNSQFRADADWQTWVFAILKNKIIDTIRHRKRENWHENNGREIDMDAQQERHFHHGHWIKGQQPSDWGDPQHYVHQQDFMKILQLCLDNLPANTARVFLMKEVMDFSIAEIVEHTGLSSENCHTIMYRARNGLRGCLQKNWFDEQKKDKEP